MLGLNSDRIPPLTLYTIPEPSVLAVATLGGRGAPGLPPSINTAYHCHWPRIIRATSGQ